VKKLIAIFKKNWAPLLMFPVATIAYIAGHMSLWLAIGWIVLGLGIIIDNFFENQKGQA
jgi:hypothetical protein